LVKQLNPDIVLIDIEMLIITGLELASSIQKKHSSKVMILITFARSSYLKRAMERGVKGYLLKDPPSDTLVDSVRKIFAGKIIVAPEWVTKAWAEHEPLSDKERKV